LSIYTLRLQIEYFGVDLFTCIALIFG
jgi:hypothetical protein